MNEITLIQNKIYEIRGQRVMLDFDLATLYRVETKALNRAVKRSIERFPERYMLQSYRISEIGVAPPAKENRRPGIRSGDSLRFESRITRPAELR